MRGTDAARLGNSGEWFGKSVWSVSGETILDAEKGRVDRFCSGRATQDPGDSRQAQERQAERAGERNTQDTPVRQAGRAAGQAERSNALTQNFKQSLND